MYQRWECREIPAQRVGAAAPGMKVTSIRPTSVAAEHKQAARHQRAGHSRHVFKTRSKQVAISFGRLRDEEVIRLSRYDASR